MSNVRVIPVLPSTYVMRPLDIRDVRLTDGFWHFRQKQNSDVVIDHADSWIDRLGWYDAFIAAAGGVPTKPLQGKLFTDADVYKTLEAMVWESAARPSAEREKRIEEVSRLIESAQEDDGYINSFFGIKGREYRYSDIAMGHEIYCAGHLFQAAVARIRAGKDDALTRLAIRFADRICEDFGPGGLEGSDGHPEIEVALMELYRATGDEKYLKQAKHFIDGRGYKTFAQHAIGHEYYVDDMPVRQAKVLRGHVVRAMYFTAGVIDLAVETNDKELLAILETQFKNTWAKRTYITSGMGSRHLGESFGDDYELSPERAYTETCGSVGALMVAWRLLLATGKVEYSDAIERILYNMIATHPDANGTRFFYVNPLLKREPGIYVEPGVAPFRKDTLRAEWFWVSCCPTNYVRLLASLTGYFVTSGKSEVTIHQYFTGEVDTFTEENTQVRLKVDTNYPWEGTVNVTFQNSPGKMKLRLRVPEWAHGSQLTALGVTKDVEPGFVDVEGDFKEGDKVVLNINLRIRKLVPDSRINAIRDTVAFERGPIVFCAEELESSGNRVNLDTFVVDSNPNPILEELKGVTDAKVAITISGRELSKESDKAWPYSEGNEARTSTDKKIQLIPYYAWSNRGASTMRVWIPTSN